MHRNNHKTLIPVLIGIVCVLLCLLIFLLIAMPEVPPQQDPALSATTPTEETGTSATTEETGTTEETTETPTDSTTEETTEPPTETEPTPIRYTLTFAGDCTLGCDPKDFGAAHSFVGTVGTDYDFPFRNVAEYFRNDDFTIVNLESVLADSGYGGSKLFTFRAPTAYSQILTGSSVEAVTLANNHSMDFGTTGYESTKQTLDSAGVAYVEVDKTQLVTTESGLVIGLYADFFVFSEEDIRRNVEDLRQQGAEIIICAFHWGNEGRYRPTAEQQRMAYVAIDAGADVIYGHHPHVLQKIEHYGDGVIFYSLGNFSFGGNVFPRDRDSAILQLEVIRETDGTIRLGELTRIPVSISSIPERNNFQPTPYEVGSEGYDRTMSKLDGTFTGPDLVVDYSSMIPTEPEETEPSVPEETEPSEPEDTTPTEPPAEAPEGGNTETPGGETTDPQPDSGSSEAPPATPEAPPAAPETGDSSGGEG